MFSQAIKIAYLSESQKIWFIRANSGLYARNFRYGKIIAIKHLEEAMGKDLGDRLPSEDEIRSAMLKNEKYFEFVEDNKTSKSVKTLNRAGSNLLGQIKRFANDICAGDIVVTKNEEGGYSVGICTDDQAYIGGEPVVLPKIDGESSNGPVLKYKLRKSVTWGPSVSRSNLPHSVRRATRGQQTVTNLSDHKEKIFHLIYPFFTDGESLYFSNKITRQSDINAIVVGKLFENISLVEGLVDSILSEQSIDLNEVLKALNLKAFAEDGFVTCKAEFMSPGDMWCKIPLSQAKELIPQLVAGVVVCLLLTGQPEAAELVESSNRDSLELAIVSSETSDIFNEKFKPAEPSKGLKDLKEKLKKKRANLASVESARSAIEIKENLGLGLTNADTSRLEGFKYGVNVIELRGSYEAN
ncbi:hypothetical protein [Pseudomonas putida]|uniref:Uncharacterized protein n=1 Tax=Pseudomonas putida TaxID=303 RepID=A0AAW4BXY2_PSEPU|nr:hypothetical protein [Pseudomonas putida]MBF8703871.1 hypothetical protein [Pseudomonas putida]MBF8738151.1 hypothetical protein [Pseudomonas putida]